MDRYIFFECHCLQSDYFFCFFYQKSFFFYKKHKPQESSELGGFEEF